MKYKLHHIAISVRNLEKSLKFYSTLGYKQVYRFDEDDDSMSIVHMKLDDSFLEIFSYKENVNKSPLHYERANNLKDVGVKHLALWVDDIEGALVDMKEKGFASKDTKIKLGRTKIRYFFIQDPDGVWVELVEDKRKLYA